MADGEINVNVKSSGTQDTLDDIASQSAEAEDGGVLGGLGGDGGKGKGKGGGVAGMLGGISGKLVAILGVLGFLASLKPIQELLTGIQRLFSVAILPLVALLNALLRPVLQKLLKFIGNLDFDNLLADLTTKLGAIFGEAVDTLVNELGDFLNPFSNDGGVSTGNQLVDATQPRGIKQAVNEGEARAGPLGSVVAEGSIGEEILVSTGLLDEQTNSTLAEKSSNRNNRETIQNGEGGLFR